MCAMPRPGGTGGRVNGDFGPKRPRYPFSREQRLPDSSTFDSVFQSGRRRVGRFMVLWVRPNGGSAWRIGVIASRRTLSRAVDRFRAKRLLREAFRLEQYELQGGADLVAVARRPIIDASCMEVRAELLKLAGPRNRGDRM